MTSFHSKNSIIYEINLSIPKFKCEDYLQFLDDFQDEMLNIPGFLSSEVFKVDSADPVNALYSVHYRIVDQLALESYLKIHQPRVSKEGQSKYQWEVLSRRVLRSEQRRIAQAKDQSFGYVF